MPGSAGPTPQGGKPGGGGGPKNMMGQMAGGLVNQMPVGDPSQIPGLGEGMAPGPGGPGGGKPGGGPPGAGGMGNPNSMEMQQQMLGGMPGRLDTPPDSMYPGSPGPEANRWGPGGGAGPGIPGPYQRMDPNDYLTERPEGFNQSLIDVAAKGKIAPHAKTAQSYGSNYSMPAPRKKKGGK